MEQQTPVYLSVLEGYSRWAKTYDTTWNTLIATEELYTLDLLDGLQGKIALDVGAGTGRYALKLARRGWHVTALDANREMLSVAEDAAANEGLSIEFSLGSIEDGLPVESGTHDLVICALTLCHIPDLRGAVREFHRALTPGGHLLVTDVHPDFVAAGMPTQFVQDGVTYHLPNDIRTGDDYMRAVADAGLNVSNVWEILGGEVPGHFETEFMRERFSSVNFSLILLVQK